MLTPDTRLDASESAFFSRQNEFIDKTVYEKVYPELKARSLIPTIGGVPDSVNQYTWRMFTRTGTAAIIGDAAGDLPRSDIYGEESSQLIKTLGTSYGWSVLEIKEAARTGTPLEVEKANSARYSLEQSIDAILATGGLTAGSTYWCRGLLNLQNTTTFTAGNKSKGGLTWANATPDEIVADVAGLVSAIIVALKDAGGQQWHSFRVVIPIAQYNLIAQKRMGDGSDMTVLRYILANFPFVSEIVPWFRAAGAGATATDRMAAYPVDSMVLGALVPMEYMTMPAYQQGISYVVPAMMRTGGVICRYPVAVGYCDGI